jgi:hypothetical protein
MDEGTTPEGWSVEDQKLLAVASASAKLDEALAALDGIPDIDNNAPRLLERFAAAVDAAQAILELTAEVEELCGDL